MNYPQINYLTDTVMKRVKPNTFKVIMCVARATWGWKKECEKISFNDFTNATGIVGRSTLNNALKDALNSGYVVRRDEGNSFCYAMIDVDFSEENGTETEPKPVRKQNRNGTETVLGEVRNGTETVPERYGNRTKNGTEIVPNQGGIKEKETITESDDDGHDLSFADAAAAYEDNIGMLSKILADDIEDAVNEFGASWVIEAIGVAVKANVRRWNYIYAVLKRWKTEGRKGRPEASQADRVMVANADGSFYG